MASKDENWIREASDYEKLYELSHQRRSFMLAYQLSFSSVLPLQEKQVKRALTHLHRKCPALRVCYGERNGQTWLRYMAKEELDFQVVKAVEPDEMRDLLQIYQYNSEEGPLWCARLLLDNERDPLALDEDLPYTSHLFLGIHHGITDGFTMMKICSGFVKILNDIICNNPINDEDQIGYFVSDTETEKIVAAKMSAIQKDPSLMQELKSAAEEKGVGTSLFLKVAPPPNDEDKTCNLTRVLDQDTTRQFLNKCKENGVSLTSGFTALANAAIVSFLVENQYIEDPYRMCNGHLINLRRYWPRDQSEGLGCHILPPLNLWNNVPKNITTNFWDFARTLHQDLHDRVKNEFIFLRKAYTKLNYKDDPSYDDVYNSPNPMQIDCTFSNLGDVTHYFEHCGTDVKMYFLLRHISLHYSDITNFSYFYHTFRGRLIVGLLYNTKFHLKSKVQEHLDQLFNMMGKVINGSIY